MPSNKSRRLDHTASSPTANLRPGVMFHRSKKLYIHLHSIVLHANYKENLFNTLTDTRKGESEDQEMDNTLYNIGPNLQD